MDIDAFFRGGYSYPRVLATLGKKLSDGEQQLIQTHIGIGCRMMKL